MRTDPKDYLGDVPLAQQTVNGVTLRDTAPAPAQSSGTFGEHVQTRDVPPSSVVNGVERTIGKSSHSDHLGERPTDVEMGGRAVRVRK